MSVGHVAAGHAATPADASARHLAALAIREAYRDAYARRRDPIHPDRLRWRAQTFRHLVHLLPTQSILELGCGEGLFTRALERATRGENPITSVRFQRDRQGVDAREGRVELVHASVLPGPLAGRRFDHVVAIDLLDKRNCGWLVQQVYELLRPGGHVVFYESNPWNVVLRLRRSLLALRRRGDPRRLLSRPALYELLSEVGFIRVCALYNDFVYAPLTPRLAWFLRNLSTVFENLPGIRTLAGSILIHAQKSPRVVPPPRVALCTEQRLRRAVSVVIPCHDEEMNVEPLVRKLRRFYGAYLHEIVLVDDGSHDGTAGAIRRLAATDPRITPVFRSPPAGVGRALADGYRVATGRWVLSMDCDFEHLLPELRDLFRAAANGYDVVVGSRFSRHSVLLNYPWQKIVANRAFHVLAQLLLRRHFRDLTNNLKLMRRSVVESLQLTQPGFAVNAETGLQPLLMGYSVKEVAISWINRTPDMGASSFRVLRAGGGYWRVLLSLAWRTALGTRRLERMTPGRP